MSLPKLPVTTYTSYNMYNEPETITESFGSTTRTKKETYDSAGRRASSETTATTGLSLPKVSFTYSSELGPLEKETTEGEGKTLTSEFNRLGQLVKYTDADGNVAKYKYAGPENDFLLEEVRLERLGREQTDLRIRSDDQAAHETRRLRRRELHGFLRPRRQADERLLSIRHLLQLRLQRGRRSHELAVHKELQLLRKRTGSLVQRYPLPLGPRRNAQPVEHTCKRELRLRLAGRLTETQETPTGEGCTVRRYAYDEDRNRASSSTRTPGTAGVCQTEGGTVEAHNYDEGGRLADGGIAYDGLGNVTKLPAADAEGQELTSSYLRRQRRRHADPERSHQQIQARSRRPHARNDHRRSKRHLPLRRFRRSCRLDERIAGKLDAQHPRHRRHAAGDADQRRNADPATARPAGQRRGDDRRQSRGNQNCSPPTTAPNSACRTPAKHRRSSPGWAPPGSKAPSPPV